jgi:hypothetical protein
MKQRPYMIAAYLNSLLAVCNENICTYQKYSLNDALTHLC